MANISRNSGVRKSRPSFQLTNVVDITVKLYLLQTYKGRPQKVEVKPDPVIEGNVQPLKFQEIMMMPEADRTREWIKIYTTTPISTWKEPYEDGNLDIYVVWEGESYRVMKEKHYVMGVLDHHVIYCAREPLSAKGL